MKRELPNVLIIGEQHPEQTFLEDFPRKTVVRRIGNLDLKILAFDIEKIEEQKKGKELVLAAATSTKTIMREIAEIKKYGGKRILYELPATEKFHRASVELKDKSGLEKFQENMLGALADFMAEVFDAMLRVAKTFSSERLKFEIPPPDAISPHMAQLLTFISASTGIYDFKFIDSKNFAILFVANRTIRKAAKYALAELAANTGKSGKTVSENDEKAKAGYLKIIDRITNTLKILLRQREQKMIKNIKEGLVDRTVVICGSTHAPVIAKGLRNVANVTGPIIIEEKEESGEDF